MEFLNKQVQERFLDFPKPYRDKLLAVRELIYEVAFENESKTGKIEETLKWGEPTYLPVLKNTGTAVRLSWLKSKPNQYGVYFHCKTSLIKDFKSYFRDKFRYEGNRAIIFNLKDSCPKAELKECIFKALTYHLK